MFSLPVWFVYSLLVSVTAYYYVLNSDTSYVWT